MGYLTTDKKKVTTKTFAEMKQAGEKVTQLTAYDFTTAGLIDKQEWIAFSWVILPRT